MKNDKGFGVVVLIVIFFVLVVGSGAYYMGKNSKVENDLPAIENNLPAQKQVQNKGNDNIWILDGKIGLTYNINWKITPETYRTPVQEMNGESPQVVGYRFTLPSGNIINWGGRQENCERYESKSLFKEFKYGISTLACVKGMKASVGLSNGQLKISAEDLNSFGDFVLKNSLSEEKIITQKEAENLVRKTWGDCSQGDCSSVIVTTQENKITAVFSERDDSVSATKKEALANYQDGIWVLGEPTITWVCQLNRGHQKFEATPCN